MLKSIEEEWLGFSAMVIPGLTKNDIRYIEMKKAFFAGAWCVHSAVVEIGEPHVSEQEGIDYLEQITDEFSEFRAKLTREYGEIN